MYRSGHNELDSKSSVPQGTVGSNPTASASSSQASYRLRRVFYASHQKLIPRSFCCSSLPNRIRCAGFRFGWETKISKLRPPDTSEQSPLCSDALLFLRNKSASSARSLAPPFQITTASMGCDLAGIRNYPDGSRLTVSACKPCVCRLFSAFLRSARTLKRFSSAFFRLPFYRGENMGENGFPNHPASRQPKSASCCDPDARKCLPSLRNRRDQAIPGSASREHRLPEAAKRSYDRGSLRCLCPVSHPIRENQSGRKAHDSDRRPADTHPQLCQDPRHLCCLPQSRILQEVPFGA